MGDDDGHSAVHLARTLTDLLLEPYFLYDRGSAVDEQDLGAQRDLGSDLIALMLEAQVSQSGLVRSMMVFVLAELEDLRWKLDLRQSLRTGNWEANAQCRRVCTPNRKDWSDALLATSCDCCHCSISLVQVDNKGIVREGLGSTYNSTILKTLLH